jgi:hypothetical protein
VSARTAPPACWRSAQQHIYGTRNVTPPFRAFRIKSFYDHEKQWCSLQHSPTRLLAHANHHTRVPGPAHDARKHRPGSIIAGKSSLQRSQPTRVSDSSGHARAASNHTRCGLVEHTQPGRQPLPSPKLTFTMPEPLSQTRALTWPSSSILLRSTASLWHSDWVAVKIVANNNECSPGNYNSCHFDLAMAYGTPCGHDRSFTNHSVIVAALL